VSETGPGGPNSSAISSYSVQSNGTLTPISASVPTLGAANCWKRRDRGRHFVSRIQFKDRRRSPVFAISNSGALTAIPGTVVGLNPAGLY